METSFAGSPSCLAGLRRAIRHSLAEVPAAIPDEVVDDLVLAVSEAATNAILYGSGDAQPVTVMPSAQMQQCPRPRQRGSGCGAWRSARP